MPKIRGTHGSWTVEVEGFDFPVPVVHDSFVDRVTMTYKEGDGGASASPAKLKRWSRHAALIAKYKIVAIQRDKSKTDQTRNGYVGLSSVDNVKFIHYVLSFDFLKGLHHEA
jgi:hypothetical protein